MQYIFSSIGTQIELNDKCEEEIWDHFNSFLLSFSFPNPKVNKYDNNHD